MQQRSVTTFSTHFGPLLCSLCLLAAPLGCAKKSKDTAAPEADAPPAAEPADVNEYPDKDPNRSSIAISDEIAEMCDIPTAHFDFDSSALSEDARTALDAVAACFNDGPAAGRAMNLVGHADPRGTEEYNLALGQRRAGSVASYLTEQGLKDGRLETSSRGELDARGIDEASWVLDRKVEISLAD